MRGSPVNRWSSRIKLNFKDGLYTANPMAANSTGQKKRFTNGPNLEEVGFAKADFFGGICLEDASAAGISRQIVSQADCNNPELANSLAGMGYFVGVRY